MAKPTASTQEFELPSVPPAAWMLLVGLWLAVLAWSYLRPSPQHWTATYSWSWVVPIFASALIVVGPFVWMQRRRIEIRDGQLRIDAGIRTRKFDIAAFDLDKARILDLGEHTEFKPLLKLGGVGLPGFKAGRFLLHNRSRAFCLLVGTEKALLLPLRESPDRKEKILLLSPSQPQKLLACLRERQADSSR